MLIINNRFLSLYDYNFLLVNQRLEKIFLEKPDWKKKENRLFMETVIVGDLWAIRK
jgi:hypothetical protein